METNNQVESLITRRSQLREELSKVNDELKVLKVKGVRGKRGRVASGESLSDAVVTLLRDKGPLPAGEIISALSGEDGGCKDTSVRTLLSTLYRDSKITRQGSKGSFVYSVAS